MASILDRKVSFKTRILSSIEKLPTTITEGILKLVGVSEEKRHRIAENVQKATDKTRDIFYKGSLLRKMGSDVPMIKVDNKTVPADKSGEIIAQPAQPSANVMNGVRMWKTNQEGGKENG